MCEPKKSSDWKYVDKANLKDYVVIIPSVAVGNVGQLTCDLLISSLHLKKIASIYTSAVIPVLGYDPYDLNSNSLSSCCELYACSTRKLAVLQLRAPLVFKYAKDFLLDIVKKFKEHDIKELIILTSSFAHERKHVMTSPFRYVNNELYGSEDKLSMLQMLKHENVDPVLKIFGGGFAPLLFEISKDCLPCLILYKYCSEGDNIPDAYDMIHQLSRIISVFISDKDVDSQLVQPVSWKLLFGRPPPMDIY